MDFGSHMGGCMNIYLVCSTSCSSISHKDWKRVALAEHTDIKGGRNMVRL
jgi:hypothetical protein